MRNPLFRPAFAGRGNALWHDDRRPTRRQSRDTPWLWALLLAAALPWLQVPVGAWVLYPGHLALTAALLVLVAREPGCLGVLPGLWPLLALSAYVAGLTALRGQWGALGVTLGTTAAHSLWAAAAYLLARGRQPAEPMRDGLVALLGISLALGLLTWALASLWPAACALLPCEGGAAWPLPFRGGMNSTAQYLLFLVVLAPPVGALVLALQARAPGHPATRGLALLAALAVLAGFAGMSAWGILLVAAGLLGLAWRLGPEGWRLVRGLAVVLAFEAVFLYGLMPGYLATLVAHADSEQQVRIVLDESPHRLSSQQHSTVMVRVVNSGWETLGSADAPARLVARLVVTPERGAARRFPLAATALPTPLAPGATTRVPVTLHAPHWLREGYVVWSVTDAAGQPVALEADGTAGFRVTNPAWRPLQHDPENSLSALTHRARAFARSTDPLAGGTQAYNGAFMALGDALDTLFFSPLWGEAPRIASDALPFGLPRPFWLQLLAAYGLLALLPALWFLYVLARRAQLLAHAAAEPAARLAWALLPLSLALLFGAGWFTSEVGSYHALWAVFLLAGWVEGRYQLTAPHTRTRPPRRTVRPGPAVRGTGGTCRPAAGRTRRSTRR